MAIHKFPVSEHTFYRVQFPYKILEKSPGTIVTGQLFSVSGLDGAFRMQERSFEQGEGGKRTLVLHGESIDRPALFWVFYRPDKRNKMTDPRALKLPKDVYPVTAIVHDGRHPVEYLVALTSQKVEEGQADRVIPVPVRDCVMADNPNEVKYSIKESA